MDSYDVLITETITYLRPGVVAASPEDAELAGEDLHLNDPNRDQSVVAVDARAMSATRSKPAQQA